MAAHRQSSLEGLLDFLVPFSLTSQQRESARALVIQLVQHYGLEQTVQNVQNGYKPAALIHAILEHFAPPDTASPDTFLHFFLSYIYEDLCSTEEPVVDFEMTRTLSYFDDWAEWDPEHINDLNNAIETFAEFIVDNFLLPFRAISTKTPQPTPTSLSSLQNHTPSELTQRVSSLRQKCLTRDRHRCVISRKFDRATLEDRFKKDGQYWFDDDRNPLNDEPRGYFDFLKVAHILPHSLTTLASGDTELSDSKKIALRILDMFDPGIGHLIDGPKIDSPLNALTLTYSYHRFFGTFQICFESTGNPHQYRIDSLEQVQMLRDPLFPITRTLTLSPTIDPPSPRLLAVHRAIAIMMKLSDAGDYIKKVLRDVEELGVREDGSTNLGHLTDLRLGGWLETLSRR